MQHRQEIARSARNDAPTRVKTWGLSAKNGMIFEQSGGLLRESALYVRLRGDFAGASPPVAPRLTAAKKRGPQ